MGVELPAEVEGEVAIDLVVLLKVLNAEGEIVFREIKSPTLHPVEALGMGTTFCDSMRSLLTKRARPA